ncbi:MAG: fused response regulator/phosphatase [Gammaproteobacteria bacterium]|nr:fused response regulator/phosphatase [Gammaproteobacteria bacterium]
MTENSKGKALIVDDELTGRILLSALLKNENFEVIQAENGQQAVDMYKSEEPDIVFMDVMMPIMDGYEATRQIKAVDDDKFVPVLFLTSMADEEALVKGIECGGDDFMVKPFDKVILKAKIDAMQRIRALHAEVMQMAAVKRHEEEIAEKVFSIAVTKGNVAQNSIKTYLKPASTFSGDMYLAEFTPGRDLHVLLGDFTGHGMAAAMGALPASQVFRAMTLKGFTGPEILAAINGKLHSMLPTGIFMACQFVSVSHDLEHITICNCGMPDIRIVDGGTGAIKSRHAADGLSLAIMKKFDTDGKFHHIKIKRGDRVLFTSDGATEATSSSGEEFGEDKFDAAVEGAKGKKYSLPNVINRLEAFCGDQKQTDDVSIVEIPCVPESLPEFELGHLAHDKQELLKNFSSADQNTVETWETHLVLKGSRLQRSNPVPLLINQIEELEGLYEERNSLFTVLTELYVNALDHGVLGLSSELKNSPEGFQKYFNEREQRLSALDEGYVNIKLNFEAWDGGGRMIIHIEDSGEGFDVNAVKSHLPVDTALCGRGLGLIRELCESLEYFPPGNKAQAVYVWSSIKK